MITFLGIFSILLLSAISLRLHDAGKKEACAKVNYTGSRSIIAVYFLLNMFFIALAIV
jgi:hypothetical protein